MDDINLLEINKTILDNLKKQLPDKFSDINIVGKNLVYNGKQCNISNFNIYDLLYSDTMFSTNLPNMDSLDFFNIIRINTESLNDNQVKQFYNLVSSKKDLDELLKKQIIDYYEKIKEMFEYEDYLLPNLRTQLTNFINYVTNLELEERELNTNEINTINMYESIMEDKVKMQQQKELETLKLTKKLDNNGNTNTDSLILTIILLATILTYLTLFLTR